MMEAREKDYKKFWLLLLLLGVLLLAILFVLAHYTGSHQIQPKKTAAVSPSLNKHNPQMSF